MRPPASLLSIALLALTVSCGEGDPPGGAPDTPTTETTSPDEIAREPVPARSPGESTDRYDRILEALAELDEAVGKVRAEMKGLDLETDWRPELERIRCAITLLEVEVLSERLPEFPKDLPSVPPRPSGSMPPIEGQVTGTDEDLNIVLVSVGRDDGVEVGFTMTVYREDRDVGKLIIEKVGPDWSSGHMDMGVSKAFPRKGDSVAR